MRVVDSLLQNPKFVQAVTEALFQYGEDADVTQTPGANSLLEVVVVVEIQPPQSWSGMAAFARATVRINVEELNELCEQHR